MPPKTTQPTRRVSRMRSNSAVGRAPQAIKIPTAKAPPSSSSIAPTTHTDAPASVVSYLGRVWSRLRTSRRTTLDVAEVDVWLRFNRFVRHGYRPSRLGVLDAGLSIFTYLHNETANILSHLFACVLMMMLAWCAPWRSSSTSVFAAMSSILTDDAGLVDPSWPTASARDVRFGGAGVPPHHDHQDHHHHATPDWLLRLLCACFAINFALSVVYHVWMASAHSAKTYACLLQCDVLGVVLSVSCSALPYFTWGNPCTSSMVMRGASGLMLMSSALTIFTLVLQPMQESGWRWVKRVGTILVDASVAVGWMMAEKVSGAVLPPPHPQDGHALHHEMWRRRCRFQRWRSSPTLEIYDVAPPPPQQQQQHGPCSSHHHNASQRAAIVGAHCAIHFLCYLLLILPKRYVDGGGHVQAAYYHGAAYAWLIVGGILNALRWPERIICAVHGVAQNYMAEEALRCGEAECRRVLKQQRRAARCHRGGHAHDDDDDVGDVLTTSFSSFPLSWMRLRGYAQRFIRYAAYWIMTYIMSPVEVCYVGNSHNLWHVCSLMSGLCAITGTWYDGEEYYMIRCST